MMTYFCQPTILTRACNIIIYIYMCVCVCVCMYKEVQNLAVIPHIPYDVHPRHIEVNQIDTCPPASPVPILWPTLIPPGPPS